MIKNKFYCGQEVWFIDGDENVCIKSIYEISMEILPPCVLYNLSCDYDNDFFVHGSKIFATEQEAKDALLLSKAKFKVGELVYFKFSDLHNESLFAEIEDMAVVNGKVHYFLDNIAWSNDFSEDMIYKTDEECRAAHKAEAEEKTDYLKSGLYRANSDINCDGHKIKAGEQFLFKTSDTDFKKKEHNLTTYDKRYIEGMRDAQLVIDDEIKKFIESSKKKSLKNEE